MKITEILNGIKESFNKVRIVEIKELGLVFELGNLTSEEEIRVLEACDNVDGAQYISSIKRYSLAYAIKKINDIIIGNEIECEDKDGNKVLKSKFLYMEEQISLWPSSVIELLFQIYSNLQVEIEEFVKNNSKFELFSPSEPIKEEENSKFKRIEEKEDTGDTDVEKLNKQVEKEIEEANQKIASAEEVK